MVKFFISILKENGWGSFDAKYLQIRNIGMTDSALHMTDILKSHILNNYVAI